MASPSIQSPISRSGAVCPRSGPDQRISSSPSDLAKGFHPPVSTPGQTADAPSSSCDADADAEAEAGDESSVELLVELLIAAKRSLSTMNHVLRADSLATLARQLHEESMLLSAQTSFLRRGAEDQTRLLKVVRGGLDQARKVARRDFKTVVRTLDAANDRLQETMAMLRGTVVEKMFRPAGETDDKCLLDFVDETSVDGLRRNLKESLDELQAAQTSFDGDLLRFDSDLGALKKSLASAPQQLTSSLASSSPANSYMPATMAELLACLTSNSHDMAEHLASLTRHFDMCGQAVRMSEGGIARARRKVAETVTLTSGMDNNGVSISGVLAEPCLFAGGADDLENMTPQHRREMVAVVMQDALEVDDVVADLETALVQAEGDFAALKDLADRVKDIFVATLNAFHVLEDVGARLASYVAAGAEFASRWENEKDIIGAKLQEMDELRRFYEGYANAYDSLILEAERRRGVEEKVAATWRKASELVERLVEADRKERETFRGDVGDFLPTDLWVGMSGPLTRFEVVPVEIVGSNGNEDAGGDGAGRQTTGGSSTPSLDRSVVEAARERMERAGQKQQGR